MKKKNDPALVTHPLDVVQPAVMVGGASAIPGLITGALYGTLRTETPALFAIFSGAQCFAIGSTFWLTRAAVLNKTGLLNYWNVTRGAPTHIRDDLNPSPSDKVRASTIAGAFTGFSLAFLFRGPRNVIPGTLMFTVFGWTGQHGYNFLDKRNSQGIREQIELRESGEDTRKETFMHKIAKSKWSPMSVLTDEQYEGMLQEKLLRVEADIAIIDEKIDEFRKLVDEMETKCKMDGQTKVQEKA
ncbi:hypothetical protein GQ44DRAFT_706492 [Phaeosphaeriaceae sp. PMI808]|nr:hypothetical protein GQ44DRAFT_706492 [Phaeosphaeriaceae sp. PMI808]